MDETLELGPPERVLWLVRWGLRVGVGVFGAAVAANLVFTPAGQWLPFAIISLAMGVATYYMLRVVLRAHLWIGNVCMSQDRVRRFLIFALGFAGVFALMLLVGLVLWPKTYVVMVLAIAMPAGTAMSAVRLWKEISAFPAARA